MSLRHDAPVVAASAGTLPSLASLSLTRPEPTDRAGALFKGLRAAGKLAKKSGKLGRAAKRARKAAKKARKAAKKAAKAKRKAAKRAAKKKKAKSAARKARSKQRAKARKAARKRKKAAKKRKKEARKEAKRKKKEDTKQKLYEVGIMLAARAFLFCWGNHWDASVQQAIQQCSGNEIEKRAGQFFQFQDMQHHQ